MTEHFRSYAGPEYEYRIRPNGDKIVILAASDYNALLEAAVGVVSLADKGYGHAYPHDSGCEVCAADSKLRTALKGN